MILYIMEKDELTSCLEFYFFIKTYNFCLTGRKKKNANIKVKDIKRYFRSEKNEIQFKRFS